MWLVLGITVAAVALLVWERFPAEQIAIGVAALLMLTGVLSPDQAVSGFANQATVTIAAMLILSLGLVKTGAMDTVGRWLRNAHLGPPAARLILATVGVAVISPFLNNTAVVVIFLPVFLVIAGHANEPPSRYLMPLSYAAILGGTVTIIGTSTNLVVAGMARSRGLDELTMFSITPLGLIYLGVGLLYLLVVGPWLLPRRVHRTDLTSKYDVRKFITEFEVTPRSSIAGRRLSDLRWSDNYGVAIIGTRRGPNTAWVPGPEWRVAPGDILYAQGDTPQLLNLARKEGLETPLERSGALDLTAEDARLAEVLVAPHSAVAGRTLAELRFRQRFDATVIAIQHRGITARRRLDAVRLSPGDLLLVHGSAAALAALADDPAFVPLSAREAPARGRPRALVAVAVLAAVVVLVALGVLPIMTAAVVGAVVMIFSRCVSLREVYEELDWTIIFLLAGFLPLGLAMEESGAAVWMVGHLIGALEGLPPQVIIGAFYLFTSVATELMSNTATAILLTPIALQVAERLAMNPYALLVAVMFGASASFMTPTGYQTNTMVYGPGNYRFVDFIRLGAPLNLLLVVVAAVCIPIFWPP